MSSRRSTGGAYCCQGKRLNLGSQTLFLVLSWIFFLLLVLEPQWTYSSPLCSRLKPTWRDCVKSKLSLVFRFPTKHLASAFSRCFAGAATCFGEGHRRVSEGQIDSWLGVSSLSWEEVSAICRAVYFSSRFDKAGGSKSSKRWSCFSFDREVRQTAIRSTVHNKTGPEHKDLYSFCGRTLAFLAGVHPYFSPFKLRR